MADPTLIASYLSRLNSLNDELIALFAERPIVTEAYFRERARVMQFAVDSGLSATAARDQADRDTIDFKHALNVLEADILVRVEQRDHLRFVIDHLD